jgi:predicted aspartyl protease
MALNQRVVSSHFPYLPLQLEIRQELHELEALLDTGFDGYVAIS